MSNFLNLASKYTPKDEPLVQADIDLLAEVIPLLADFDLSQLVDEQQDRAAQVYARLTGKSYNKFCKSCQINATHVLRKALAEFHAIRAHQKMIPSENE